MGTILVFSNKPENLKAVALVLEFGGHSCEIASSVEEAVKFLEGEAFDLFVAVVVQVDSMRELERYLQVAPCRTPALIRTNASTQTLKDLPGISILGLGAPDQLFQAIDTILQCNKVRANKVAAGCAKAAAA